MRTTLLNIFSSFSSIWTILESFRLLNIFSEGKLGCPHVPRYQYIWKQGDRKVWSYILGQILSNSALKVLPDSMSSISLFVIRIDLKKTFQSWGAFKGNTFVPYRKFFCQWSPDFAPVLSSSWLYLYCLGDGCEVALNLILIRVRCKFPSSSPRPPVNRANRGGSDTTQINSHPCSPRKTQLKIQRNQNGLSGQ